MTAYRSWCWELAAQSRGPDWMFVAEANGLGGLSALAPPAGFVADPREPGGRSFIDAGSLETRRAGQNMWVYNAIWLADDTLNIAAGYGGRGEQLGRAETAFLLDLLARPGVELRAWKLLAGGDGYSSLTLRRGDDIASLLAYLGVA